jgi:hypothetical protein
MIEKEKNKLEFVSSKFENRRNSVEMVNKHYNTSLKL